MMYSLEYFEKYMLYKKRLDLCEFEQVKNGSNKILADYIENEKSDIIRQMSEIKKTIDNYQPNTIKNYTHARLFLRCRYIDGMTMEQTADFMDISRNTVYRIKRNIERQFSS